MTLSRLPYAFCFVSAYVKFAHEFLTLSLCNLSLASLADLTLSDSTALIRFIASLANYTLLFVWIKRHDHSVYMSSILHMQLYTAGIPLLEAYLLPMANNRTCRNERLSAASHVGPDSYACAFPWSKKMADLSCSRMQYKQKTL